MRESKYQLQQWKRWKYSIEILEETMDQLKDTSVGISYDTTSMPGGNHKTIHEKYEHIIEECEKYEETIKRYKFFVERLEKSINLLLTREEKIVVLIYANNQTSSKREIEALHSGYSRTIYYEVLNKACNKLDEVLSPKVTD